MSQLSSIKIQKPFGEVDVWKQPDGRIRVKATILMKPNVENAQTGLAIDASKSMSDLFGTPPNFFDDGQPNKVEKVARRIAEYLANFDSDGETTVIYYAMGKFGAETKFLGEMSAEKALAFNFDKPSEQEFGTGTRLVPAINFFLNRFTDAPWLICLFITDGLIDDLKEAKELSRKICLEMKNNERGFTKFVIIGLGHEFFEGSPASAALEELDDLDEDPEYGVPGQDLWDHKIALNIQSLDEMFAEVVSENTIVCKSAQVLDSNGDPVKPLSEISYSDGLPSLLRFTMPANSTSFTLRLPNGNTVTQDITSAL